MKKINIKKDRLNYFFKGICTPVGYFTISIEVRRNASIYDKSRNFPALRDYIANYITNIHPL